MVAHVPADRTHGKPLKKQKAAMPKHHRPRVTSEKTDDYFFTSYFTISVSRKKYEISIFAFSGESEP